jgi:hypothetical protein
MLGLARIEAVDGGSGVAVRRLKRFIGVWERLMCYGVEGRKGLMLL